MNDRYAVIGNPISHSKSPLIHAAFAHQTHQAIRYDALLSPLDSFQATVRHFQEQGGKGLNITVPFKLEAYQLATRLTDRAASAQAANTLKFDQQEILGDNTDGAGLVRDIECNLGIPFANKRILLMGAGGAARGVILPMLQQQPSLLAIANRTPEKARALEQLFSAHGQLMTSDYATLRTQQFDIIINATSASLNDALPELPPELFEGTMLVYDMMYGPDLTRFLKYAQQHGAQRLADGLGMLVEQAAESFFIWRGIRPQTHPVISMLQSRENPAHQ